MSYLDSDVSSLRRKFRDSDVTCMRDGGGTKYDVKYVWESRRHFLPIVLPFRRCVAKSESPLKIKHDNPKNLIIFAR